MTRPERLFLDDITLHVPQVPIEPMRERKRPLRVGVISSVRDLGGWFRVGDSIESPAGRRYVEGVCESLVLAGPSMGVEVVCVINDDDPGNPRDLEQMKGYAFSSDAVGLWLFPRTGLEVRPGVELASLCRAVPSEYRRLPLRETERRREGKATWEHRVLNALCEADVDIVVSDHLLIKLESLFRAPALGAGRVLNLHPAVTNTDSPYCCRGYDIDPIFDAAQATGYARTGATLHIIEEEIDAGPIIAEGATISVYSDDTWEDFCYWLHAGAKNPICLQGLQHYASLL